MVPAQQQNRLTVVDGRFMAADREYAYGKPVARVPSAASLVKKTTVPKRVLIVEDNLDSVHSLALLVGDMGHAVEYAINGYVALEVARRFHPEFVLLDLGLPGLDGFEVCTRIKQDRELQRARVIALTAFAQDEYRVRAMAAGCELHIVKPVPIWVLEELLG